jgi:hypothetical protein
MLQFRQQPALFQRAVALRCSHRLLKHERFSFAHRPNGCRYRVPTQLLHSGNAFVSVDHQIAVGLILNSHNDDRYLLTCGCQRSQQPSLPLRVAHAQMFESQIQLVKLNVHTGCPHNAP